MGILILVMAEGVLIGLSLVVFMLLGGYFGYMDSRKALLKELYKYPNRLTEYYKDEILNNE